jgi:uncharacterized Zn-finger protein
MNTDTVAVGIILIVVGVVFGALLCFGGVLAIVGLVLLIMGLVESEPAARVYVPAQVGPAGSINFCPYCGQNVFAGAVRCPNCGRALPGSSGP